MRFTMTIGRLSGFLNIRWVVANAIASTLLLIFVGSTRAEQTPNRPKNVQALKELLAKYQREGRSR